jgi:hypothetical protein
MSWEDFIRTFSDIEVSHKTMRSGPGAMGSAEAGGCPLGQLFFHKGISKLFDAQPDLIPGQIACTSFGENRT